MDETHKALIAYYEEEKRKLLQQIEAYTREWDYQFAHYQVQALLGVQGILRKLYRLNDRHYSKKRWKEESIERLEKELLSQEDAYMQKYLAKMLEREREALKKLNGVHDPVNEPPGGGAFQEALDALLERKIRSFTLFLSREDNLLLSFSFKANVLKVAFPYVKRHLKTEMLEEGQLKMLENMGFASDKRKRALVLFIRGNRKEMESDLKWSIAKIVFDVFDFASFTGKSAIGIKEKGSR